MKLRTQIGIGLVLAGSLVAGLQWYVSREAEADTDVTPARTPDRTAPPDRAAEGRGLLDSLEATVEHFHLATNPEQFPAGCRPVLRIRSGGVIEVAEPPPTILRPGAIVWQRMGVLLPQARISDLSASERSSLVLVWSRLSGEEPLRPDRVHVHGCVFGEGELALLLRWLR